MPDEFYIPRNPGDLITAEDWNDLQKKVKQDIGDQTKKAIDGIQSVKKAEDTTKLEGKTIEELTKEILDKVLKEIPKRTGYLQLFKRLKVGQEEAISHKLKAFPLVDVYQLDYFRVVCSEDGNSYEEWVNLYLYHSSEKRLRLDGADSVVIESTDSHPYKIPFSDLLAYYQVQYTDDSSLGDVENDFWKAFFADPNDKFDDDQYCHSPWFDRCCCENRTVGTLKQRGDWDDLWLQMRPRKTINYPTVNTSKDQDSKDQDSVDKATLDSTTPAPTQIQVVHFDFDTVGIKLLVKPLLTNDLLTAMQGDTSKKIFSDERQKIIKNELKVMLLLKV